MWFIKRVKLDGSETDMVMREAEEIGLCSRGLKDFAVKYAAAERQYCKKYSSVALIGLAQGSRSRAFRRPPISDAGSDTFVEGDLP